MPTNPIPPRSQVATEKTWDTASIFPSKEAWQNAFDEVEQELSGLKLYQGRLGENPQTLYEFLQLYERIANHVDLVSLWARLNYAVDTTDQEAKANNDKVTTLHAKAMAAFSFAEPEILQMGLEKVHLWEQEYPDLTVYDHYFNRLERRAPHVRSAEVEKLLSQVQDPFRTAAATHGILVNAEMPFEPALSSTGEQVEVDHANIGHLLSSRDRDLRRTAWQNYADGHLAFKNTQANALAASIKQDVFTARARNYNSSLEAALAPNAIPVEVFHNLIDTFQKHIPTWLRYWKLRRRVLGLEEIHVYDTRAALIDSMPVVHFDQAVQWVTSGMAPLGEEYVNVLRKGVLEERWVDRAINKGKRFGAFSSGVKGSHPFINMSFNEDINSMSTLAHELGHSMHSYYSRGTQPYIYSNYGTFLAEVASNFNQALVRAHLLGSQKDPDLQVAIIEEAMNNFHRYFFIMPTLARFELEIHQRAERGQPLTAQNMIELMADLFSEGYGEDVIIDRERVGSVWMQFSTHLYMNFYVFQYATGISGAHALANAVLTGSEDARQRYLNFLKAGGSRYPLETLQKAGVDLASPKPVEETFGIMESMIDRLEEILL